MSSTRNQYGDDLIGARLADYTIKRLIAKGGMGRVYEAVDNELGRSVAIKVITLEEEAADEMLERFKREAKAIGQLDNHPNIVTIYRYGKARGVNYIAMQYVNGQSLGDYVRDLRDKDQYIPPAEMVDILRQVAEALNYAHQHEVIHRDIKPANVMLEADPNRKGMWRAILMDFGLVLRANNTMTTGSAFGTPRYIAPEQALSSADANPRSDIYSLGVMVYEMLAGRPPFEDDDTPIGVALSHVTKPPPDPQTIRSDLPDAVVPVLMKVLEKEPEKRYQTATEFIEAVAKALGLTSQGVALSESERTLMQAELPAKPKDVVAHPLTPVAVPAPIPRPGPTEAKTEPQPRQSRNWLPIAAGLVVLAALALVGLLALGGGSGDESNDNGDDPIAEDSSDAGVESPEAGPPASREGRLELYYANDLLLIRNGSNDALDLRGMSFRQGEQQFSLADFGRSTLSRWPIGQCAYVQVLNHTADPIESNCASEQFTLPLEYVNANLFVWGGDEAFEVRQDGETLATCTPSEGNCVIQGVKQASN